MGFGLFSLQPYSRKIRQWYSSCRFSNGETFPVVLGLLWNSANPFFKYSTTAVLSYSASILQMDELIVFAYHTAALYAAMQWSSCSGNSIDSSVINRPCSSSCAPLVLNSDLLLWESILRIKLHLQSTIQSWWPLDCAKRSDPPNPPNRFFVYALLDSLLGQNKTLDTLFLVLMLDKH